MSGLVSSYPVEMLNNYFPDKVLRSSCKGLLIIWSIKPNLAHGAFSHYDPALYISLIQ